ncbi:MAG: anthranilate phosphoribosyltransferase [Candidatus Puniceispirillaceae bacterium]
MSEKLHNITKQIIDGTELPEAVMRTAFDEIMEGLASPVELASFLVSLRMRGETPDDIAAGAGILRNKALSITAPDTAMDIVGTGGDKIGTYNISTATAMVVAGTGVPVAKHGNKAVSSKSGAADVLTMLGINMDCPFDALEDALTQAGVVFLMAPRHHAAMRHVGPIRAELGVRTIFNLLGPLSNPAKVSRILVGSFDAMWLHPFAEALDKLGTRHAWIVHGADGLDELSTTGNNQIVQLHGGKIKSFTLNPSELGLKTASLEEIKGGSPEVNATALRQLLEGQTGPYRDIVLLNAAGALVAGGHEEQLSDALARAEAAIDSKKALNALDTLISITNKT